jgi:hypothetical protein
MKDSLVALSRDALFSLRDLAPIVLVIAVFQVYVIKQPVHGIGSILIGAVLVVVGLTFFIFGLRIALFPVGEGLAHSLARKGSVFWLFTFAFVLGFGTTIAEPALIAVAAEAAEVAVDAGFIAATDAARSDYALGLRLVVALSVGVALIIGVYRILANWSLPVMIIGGYILVILATTLARAVGYGTGCGSREFAERPQPDDRRLWPDRVRLADTDLICACLWNCSAMDLILDSLKFVANSAVDVLPIVIFLFAFQVLVIGGRMPNVRQILVGFVFVIVGLGLFLEGLEQALFPLGRLMAQQLTDPEFLHATRVTVIGALDWYDYHWVYIFAAAIGFSTTLAEPALMAVSIKANTVSGGAIGIWGLRVAVAIGVGLGVGLGCYRIISGLPLQYFIAAGYVVVIVQTTMAPKLIVPLAYDSGGVTTSTVTVPLITALGLGLAEAVPGRSPLLDGFGLVAFASLFPIISVLAYGQLSVLRQRVDESAAKPEELPEEEDHAF